MTNLKAKIGSAVAMATLLSSAFAPVAFADTDVTISGNGVGSNNNVTVNNTDNTTVTQTNNSTIINVVKTYSNTGGNTANNNTDGDVDVTTGNVSTDVNVTVNGSSNTATLPDCGCSDPGTTVEVKNNGIGSINKVTVTNSKKLTVNQGNNTYVLNKVKTKSKTGWNQANNNTGGSVGITTGGVTTTVDILVTGSSNTL